LGLGRAGPPTGVQVFSGASFHTMTRWSKLQEASRLPNFGCAQATCRRRRAPRCHARGTACWAAAPSDSMPRRSARGPRMLAPQGGAGPRRDLASACFRLRSTHQCIHAQQGSTDCWQARPAAAWAGAGRCAGARLPDRALMARQVGQWRDLLARHVKHLRGPQSGRCSRRARWGACARRRPPGQPRL